MTKSNNKRNPYQKRTEKVKRQPSENQGLASDEFVFGMHATLEAISKAAATSYLFKTVSKVKRSNN